MSGAKYRARPVVLGERRVGYTVAESPTARRCRIRVSPAGVVVVVPRGQGEARAADFLQANAPWVLQQLAFQDRVGSIRVADARKRPGSLLLHGEEVSVEVVEESAPRRYALVEQDDRGLRVRVPSEGSVDPDRALKAWLRRLARRDILAQVAQRSAQLKVRPARVFVMAQRTKWGGCSRLRNLSFNWRLVMAPPAVLDYVVVHELAHLIEPYHSSRFWLIVRSHCPGFEQHRCWLRENEGRLGVRG